MNWFVATATLEREPPPFIIMPFAVLLLSIALGPTIVRHHWERHYHKLSLALAAIVAGYYIIVLRAAAPILHVLHEYVSFIALIGSLYVIAGGIHLGVKGESRPLGNCVFLLIGAVLANFIGTTGASMLLIRPWIRMNRYRITAFHIVFFIFIVSNVGGCLTPIGDPPLFLGYLKGVPFWWVAEHCLSAWAIAVVALLAVFFFIDRANFLRVSKPVRETQTMQETWQFRGGLNVFFLLVVLVAVFIKEPPGLREALMFAAAAASWFTTRREIHQTNEFTFHPIKEVAWLFLGIFATMVPALDYLQRHAGSLGLHGEMQFYWFTGILSALLDNAPTYLTFLAAALGVQGLSIDCAPDVQLFSATHALQLIAISLGAVFFGALTYIGNGPNFMVKAIAEQQKVDVPGFVRYVWKFAIPVLIPILALVSYVFFWK
jgi:Na+/H+ antiporter NhaD/arsenite permease-like protein